LRQLKVTSWHIALQAAKEMRCSNGIEIETGEIRAERSTIMYLRVNVNTLEFDMRRLRLKNS
jgi:hypothetical protein